MKRSFSTTLKLRNWLPLSEQHWSDLNLLKSLVQRSLAARHKGSVLGSLWPILNQLALILIYTFVFGVVLKAHANIVGLPEGKLTFAVWFYTGYLAWITFAHGLTGSCMSVIQQSNLVKKVVFPLYLLPLVPICAAFVESSSGFVLLLVFVTLWIQKIHLTLLLLPLIWIPQLLLMAGLGYLTAGLTVFLRDIPQTLPLILNFWFHLSAIVYPITMVPEQFRPWMFWLNPMAIIIQIQRDLILSGVVSHQAEWAVTFVLSGLVFLGGLWCYRKLSPAFADVL
jgi:lipopolysaccharide transport system permease protein